MRERERGGREGEKGRCVCVQERGLGEVRVCVRGVGEDGWERERESVCVCVCVRERERLP